MLSESKNISTEWLYNQDELLCGSFLFLTGFEKELDNICGGYAIKTLIEFRCFDRNGNLDLRETERTRSILGIYRTLAERLEETFYELKQPMDELRDWSKNSDPRELWQEQKFLWRQSRKLREFVVDRVSVEHFDELLETRKNRVADKCS